MSALKGHSTESENRLFLLAPAAPGAFALLDVGKICPDAEQPFRSFVLYQNVTIFTDILSAIVCTEGDCVSQ